MKQAPQRIHDRAGVIPDPCRELDSLYRHEYVLPRAGRNPQAPTDGSGMPFLNGAPPMKSTAARRQPRRAGPLHPAAGLCLMLALLTATGTVWGSAASELYRTQALAPLSEGAYDTALQKLELAVAADPDDIRARYFRGIAYSRLGRYAESIQDLEAAEDAGAASSALWFELGYAYYRNQRLPEAQAAFSQSLAGRPDHAPGNYYLGLVRYQRRAFAESLAPLQHAAELDPAFGAAAAYLRADALIQLQRPGEAEPILKDAIRRYPDSVYLNPMQELLDAITGPRRLTDRFEVLLSTGLVYDTNVGLFPDDQALSAGVEEDADHRLELAMDLRAHLIKNKTNNVSLGYRFFDSFHQDLGEFDVLSHAVLADLSHTWRAVTLGLNYQFVTADLDDDDFSDVHVVTPNLIVRHNQRRLSLLLLEWRNNDYDLQSETGRSGNAYSARYRYYWLGPARRYGYAGIGAVADDTDDRAFDYDGYRLELGYQHSWGRTLMHGSLSYEKRDYDDAAPDREDDDTELAIRLTRPFRNGVELEAGLIQVVNSSTSGIFDYSRTLASFALRYRR